MDYKKIWNFILFILQAGMIALGFYIFYNNWSIIRNAFNF